MRKTKSIRPLDRPRPARLRHGLQRGLLAVAATAAAFGSVLTPPAAAADAPVSVDLDAREAAYDRYHAVLKPALRVPPGWTGSVETCDAGAVTPDAQKATLDALNYFRGLAGVGPVAFDPALSQKAQRAALMMRAQGAMSHLPSPDWKCWSPEGREAAEKSNLAAKSGAAAIKQYMDEPGARNIYTGHRNWILRRTAAVMGSGSTDTSNALWVVTTPVNSAAGPDWVSWPSPGMFPVQLEPYGRWSLLSSRGEADFTNAVVRVTSGGVDLPVQIHPVLSSQDIDYLTWETTPQTWRNRPDMRVEVTVTGIRRNGVEMSHSWSTTFFDAEMDSRQTIEFPEIAEQTFGTVVDAQARATSGLPVQLSTRTPEVCTLDAGLIRGVGIGTCTVAADQPGDGMRRAAPTVVRSFSFGKRPVVVRADDQTRQTGRPDPAFTLSYEGLPEGMTAPEGVKGSPTCRTAADSAAEPGSYPIECDVSALSSEHFTFTSAPGTLTVEAAPQPLRAPGVTRFAGSDRFTTAVEISRGTYAGTASDVFIVTGSNWPDALAAGAAAARVDGPVLPVRATAVPDVVLAEVRRLDPERAWVVGGPGVVSEDVIAQLRSLGVEVTRVAGDNRYSTAAAVAARFFPSPSGAYYASGAGYADALGGGAAAARRGWPLLLTAKDSVPAGTPVVGGERIVLGGPSAVSEVVRTQLAARRISGADRYATAAAIARDAFSSAPVTYLSTGENFPDALAGAPAAARDGAPLLLVARSCASRATVDTAGALGSSSRVVLGGTAVVTEAAARLTPC